MIEDESIVTSRPERQAFEMWLGVAAVYSGVAFFLAFLPRSGSSKAVELAFPALASLWSALYALGGMGVVVGLVRRSPRIEGAGLNLLGSGLTVATIATLTIAAVLPTLILNGGLVAACMWRLLQLRRLP